MKYLRKRETPIVVQQNRELVIMSEAPVYFEKVPGFLAKPIGNMSYPGIVMMHEWYGLNDYIKKKAWEMAGFGYVVLAVDLYEGEVTTDSDRAKKLASSINQSRAVENMRAAVQYLREKENISRIGSLGWCLGGTQSLELALSGEHLNATAMFYGKVTSDENVLSRISWPVFGVFGDKDEVVPVDTVKKFKGALDKLEIENEIYIYSGLGHAFANPSNPNFAPDETQDAWEKTLDFFRRHLQG